LADRATIRRFRWSDLAEWTDLFNEVSGMSGTDRAFDSELMGQFLSQPACEPEENCFVAESGGSAVGLVTVAPELPIGRAVASGGVAERYRNRGIGRALLGTASQRAGSLGVSVLHVQAASDGPATQHILQSNGFRLARTYSSMRWQGEHVARPELPPGFGLRTFMAGRDDENLTRIQNAAFAGTWGFCPNTVEEIRARLKFKTCEPDGVIFVTRGDAVAGYNWTFRAAGPAGSTGWISMTGVHPDYRGHRLGKAVVLAGMEALTAKGVRTIELEVDEQNTVAEDIYLSVGFRRIRRGLWYEMKLAGGPKG
jgi:mycothiol synthase